MGTGYLSERFKRDKFLLALLVCLLVSAFGVLSAEAKTTVAVMNFEVNSPGGSLDYLSKGLADMLTVSLAGSSDIKIVERSRLSAALDEIGLARGGFVDERTASRIGRTVGAQSIILGTLTSIGNVLSLDARVVDVTTGEVSGAATQRGNNVNDLANMLDLLGSKLVSAITGKPMVVNTVPPAPAANSLSATTSPVQNTPAAKGESLLDQRVIEGWIALDPGEAVIDGETRRDVLVPGRSFYEVVFYLGKKFTQLTVAVAMDDLSKSDASGEITIKNPETGKVLSRITIKTFDKPKTVQVPVDGVNRLEFDMYCSKGFVYLGAPMLTK